MASPSTVRYEEIGAARLLLAKTASSQSEWEAIAKPTAPFAFRWAECWKSNVTYAVVNIAAEIGFYVSVLGMSILSIDENLAMMATDDGLCGRFEDTPRYRNPIVGND